MPRKQKNHRIRHTAAQLTLGLLFFSLTGCGIIHMNAPSGSRVKLLTNNAPASVRVEQTVWYKWWGLDPINPSEAEGGTIIAREGLTEARMQMTNTFTDSLVTLVTGIFGFPRRTLIVEGNRQIAKTAVTPSAPVAQPSAGRQ